MEDIIISKLCDFCMNKKTNCMNYKESKQKEVIVYKCNNYVKDEKKIKGYEGKWIDSILSDIAHRNARKGETI